MTKRKKVFLATGGAALAVLALAAGGFWYTFLRDDAPPEVSLAAAVDSISTPAASGTTTPTGEGAASPTTPAAAPSAADGIDGTWTIAEGQDSFAGYRVGEELANVGVTTAVGRTGDVTGEFVVDGDVLVSGSVEVDLTTLRSDKDFRDRALRDQAIETNQYPTAEFVVTGPVELPAPVASGAAGSIVVPGELTLHGVTRAVEVTLKVQAQGEYLVAVGSLPIVFADYNIEQPRAVAVVSIEDNGVMELQLILARNA